MSDKTTTVTTDIIAEFNSARNVGVPILSITTADQNATIELIAETAAKFPIVQWDASRGITSVNDAGEAALIANGIAPQPKPGQRVEFGATFAGAVADAVKLPRASIFFVHNAGRQLHSQDPASTAAAVQGIANLRDRFKTNHRTIVLLDSSFKSPAEFAHDIISLHHPLPGPARIRQIVTDLYEAVNAERAKTRRPLVPVVAATVDKAVDASSGLSEFGAEQNIAMSFVEDANGVGRLDIDRLWERARVAIEANDGMTVYRGKETLDDLRGVESVKARVRQHTRGAKKNIGVTVWIDEGSDVFANVENDTSGVKTDQQRELLIQMEQNDWRGMIFVGVPGSGKSAVARAIGNEAGVPTIQIDFGAMESKYVGESEANLRRNIDVIKNIGRGNAFFVLTCNSLKGIRPQFMRRFKRGVFFFDLPTKAEREAIWALYLKKYDLAKQPLPDDTGWTGAEIRECCESAWDLNTTLKEAASFIIPVSRSRVNDIEAMRLEAAGRFLDASKPGAYVYTKEPMAKAVRAMNLAPGNLTEN